MRPPARAALSLMRPRTEPGASCWTLLAGQAGETMPGQAPRAGRYWQADCLSQCPVQCPSGKLHYTNTRLGPRLASPPAEPARDYRARPIHSKFGMVDAGTAINYDKFNPYIVVPTLTLLSEQYFCIKVTIIALPSLGEPKMAARNILL